MKAMIFSGYGEFEYARRAMRFGVEEYILKPVNPTEFQNAIKKILRVLEESKQEKSRKQTEARKIDMSGVAVTLQFLHLIMW